MFTDTPSVERGGKTAGIPIPMKQHQFPFFKAVVSAACVFSFFAGCTANNPDSLGDGDDTIDVVTIESLNIQVKDINKSLNEYKTTMNLLSSYVVELQNKVNALDGQGYTDLKSKVDALEGKVTAFENALKDLDGYTDLNTWVSNLNNGLNSLSTLQDAVNEAKTSITGIITRLNGLDQTTANIASELNTKTKQLTDDLSKCSTDISGMMDRLAALENSVSTLQQEIAALISAVQSVVVVPDYADGSVKMTDGQNNVLRFEVYPTTAAQKLAEVGLSAFSLDCVETETKTSIFTNIPITAVSFDGEVLSVTADGSGLKESIKDGTQPANARLRITDGKVTRSSEYFALTYKTSSGEPIAPDVPSGDLIGAYALDDGTSMSNSYISFSKGKMYEYQSYNDKFFIAENYIWSARPEDFTMVSSQEYSLGNGILYRDGVPYGTIQISDEQVVWEGNIYRKFIGLKAEQYTTIIVDGDLSRSIPYQGEILQIPVSVSKTVPSGKLVVQSPVSWLSYEINENILNLCVAGNDTWTPRNAQVLLSYPGARTIILTINQAYNIQRFNPVRTFEANDMWFSFNADNMFIAGIIPTDSGDNYQATWGSYSYEDNKYTMYGKDAKVVWGTLEVVSDNAVKLKIGEDEPLIVSNLSVSVPDASNIIQQHINRIWNPVSLTVQCRGAVFNRDGVNLDDFEEWATSIGFTDDTLVHPGMVMRKVIISDARICFIFENGQIFIGRIPSGTDLTNFTMTQIPVEDTDNLPIFQGQTDFVFSGDRCYVCIIGKYQDQSISTILTLSL